MERPLHLLECLTAKNDQPGQRGARSKRKGLVSDSKDAGALKRLPTCTHARTHAHPRMAGILRIYTPRGGFICLVNN